MATNSNGGWRSKLSEALVLVLVVALVARVAWELMAPLVPTLIGFVVVVAALGWFFRRRDHW
jgi:NhaP-type Na+/H+ or K+/H+ antiporter